MLQNYFKVAFRNLLKHKGYSAINILGLALGMAVCILILLYVQDELSYDRFHEHADQMYRIEREGVFNGEDYRVAVTPLPAAPVLAAELPEIEAATRIYRDEYMLQDAQNEFSEQTLIFADGNLFETFTFPLIEGDPRTALTAPNRIVLTRSLATRLLGKGDPVGKTVIMQDWETEGRLIELNVTGVMADIPKNSHVHSEAFVSFATFEALLEPQYRNTWLSNFLYTYVRLHDEASPALVTAKMPALLDKYMGPEARQFMGDDVDLNTMVRFELMPITAIHLHSRSQVEIEPGGSMSTIYTFTAIALLILLIACINFMNLSTARSAGRAQEVGMRKALGAQRQSLIWQFLGESILMSALALVLALGIVELVLPYYNNFVEKDLAVDYLQNPSLLLGLIAVAGGVGLLAGSYPAFFLSAFQPISVLKGKISKNSRSALLRKGLVILQFSISIVLIIGTLIIFKQIQYVQNKHLGFAKEQVLVIPTTNTALKPQVEALKTELSQQPGVMNVAASNKIPGDWDFSDTAYLPEGATEAEMRIISFFYVDDDFLPTLAIELAAGRNFSPEFASDADNGLLINEAAMQSLGWLSAEEAVGKVVSRPVSVDPLEFEDIQVVGVMKDFHYRSLHDKISPLVLRLGFEESGIQYLTARVQVDQLSTTLAALEGVWQQFSPGYPFDYFFLDDRFDQHYRADRKAQQIFGYFTILAIFVASLGLFGLAAYTAEQRTKEIGIRKVMGATIPGIVMLLSGEFLKLVLVANVIAFPVAYYAMNRWLQSFAYHVEIGWSVFALAAGFALLIALVTVSFQAIKAALMNPIKALRYE